MATIRSCTSFEGARIHAISADRIFDGEWTLVGHAVLIDGDRVAGVVPLGSLPPEINVQMDEGCTIMPGLAAGSAADLVAVRGNPLESIPERPELTRILRGGEPFDPRTLLLQSQHPTLTDDPWTAELARSL